MVPIFFEDDSILVCEKPAGILSQSSPGCEESMLSILEKQAGGTFYPIHRLDRGVGGVMVFARTPKAAAALSQAVQQRTLEKEYLCIVQGCPEAPEGVYRDLLFKDSSRNKSFVVTRMRKGVKEASLGYRVLEQQGDTTLVLVKLHTGRTHQIRVQFSSRKMPLLGDTRYGGRAGEGIALWSYRLAFSHPRTGEQLSFSKVPSGGIWDTFQLSGL